MTCSLIDSLNSEGTCTCSLIDSLKVHVHVAEIEAKVSLAMNDGEVKSIWPSC